VVTRLGNVLYWTANWIAFSLASVGAVGFVIALINKAGDGIVLFPIVIVLAVPIWLFGRACRYVLAGR